MKPIAQHTRCLSVAPMMDWTDRHCRYFHRLLTRRTVLYTEMITTGAVLHGDRGRLMAEPQLVGGCVAAMKAAVRVPVTVKCRLGIDEQDPEEALDQLAQAAIE